IAAYGLERTARHVRDAGLRVSGVCRGGMFTLDGATEDNRRAVDEAAALGADCLVMVVGGLPAGSRDLGAARDIVAEGIATLLPYARARNVKLALEPLHPMTCADRSVLSTLAQALNLAEAAGPEVGVAIDVYHVWWDPALAASIARARGRIHAFHVCDWRVPTRDLVFDRAMMGDGAIDIAAIRGLVETAGYSGLIEVEIMSTQDWWTRPPDDVLTAMKERFSACV
ncbi:MAG: sugar phosphate isomerase/epimerase, partial [Acetobacteraceae bacterium]|nr:sugar phosphate isomerase/epimerase [Acetobacteraceae bacterium]